MQFNSEAQRQLHPEARLIPIKAWEDYALFANGLNFSKAVILLMQKSDAELLTCINASHRKLPICCWLAIAYSHPLMSDERLMQIALHLEINRNIEDALLYAALTLGRISFLETYFSNHDWDRCTEKWRMILRHGNLHVLEWLMATKTEQEQREIAIYDNYFLFQSAASYGHLPFMEYLIALAPDHLQSMIAAGNGDYWAFTAAVSNGHLDVVELLIKLVAPHKLDKMISNNHRSAISNAALWGHKNVITYLLGFPSVLAHAESTRSHDSTTYVKYTQPFIQTKLANLHASQCQIKERHPDVVFNIEDAEEAKLCFYILRNLIRRNDQKLYDEIRFLLDIPSVKALAHQAAGNPNEFAYCHIDLLYVAVDIGNYKAAELLLTIPAVVEQLPQIDWRHERWFFEKVARAGNRRIINHFLNIPTVLAYAEGHRHEYARFTDPFIVDKLASLHGIKADVEAENPHAVFNIENVEEAKLCFYILRNIIRRNDPRLLDEMRFLLDIPSVKALAHQAATPTAHNELLRLAVTIGNRAAATLLLNINAVRLLSEQDGHYLDEARGGINLAALAQDRESSMHALSVGEQKRLGGATALYKPRLTSLGIPAIMTSLRAELQARYIAHPATIDRNDGSKLDLPMDWVAFQALGLSELKLEHQDFSEKEQALRAYYQHKDHTAYRYLSHPNPWMHSRASYVEINPNNPDERWSTFEEYQPLIAMLFLAATDEKTAACDGYTLETRLEHFIAELAQIGRAHNWDKTRMKFDAAGNLIVDEDGNPISEEYDDLEADRPSCYSGVKRRLFQSVLGHPLLKILTKESIDEELRGFVRQHFMECINVKNRSALIEAWDNVVSGESNTKDSEDLLKTLNISEKKQAKFIQLLEKKYGAQFSDDKSFQSYVKKTFSLNKQDKTAMHASQFGYLGLDQILESADTSSGSKQELHSDLISSGFFLKVMCSTSLKVVAGLLLTAGLIAIILGTCGIAALPLAPTIAIGATSAALGAGLSMGSFFSGRQKHKPEEASEHSISSGLPY